MTDLFLEILGCRGAAPLGGGCPAYLVTSARTTILLDCGPGTVERLHARNLLGRLDAIVISHPHMDHILDLLPLSGEVVDARVGRRTPLRLPAGGEAVVRGLAAALGDEPRIDRSFDVRPYAPDDTVRIGDLTLTFAPTDHPQPCCAIRVTDGDRTLVYGADGAPSPALDRLAAGADLLLLEATGRHVGHSTATDSRALAAQLGARVVLTHLIDDDLAGRDVAREGMLVPV